MNQIPNDAVITFFDGFSKSAYIVYSADTGGYQLSIEDSMNIWIMNSKHLFDYLGTRFEFTYDTGDMMAISHDLSSTRPFEEMMAYFWKICNIFTNPEMVITSNANQDWIYWKLSDDAIISYYIGMTWLFHKNENNRYERIQKFLILVKEHLKLTISNQRIDELYEYFMNDCKIEEIKLKAFELLQIKHCLTGNLKHMDNLGK